VTRSDSKLPRLGMRPFSSQLARRLEFSSGLRNAILMSRSRRWRKNTSQRMEARAALHTSTTSMMEERTDYSAWSHEKLIERVTALENELQEKNRRYTQYPILLGHFTDWPAKQYNPPPYPREKELEETPHRARLRSYQIQYSTRSSQARIPRQKIQWVRVF
jgi:hypothetical protein